MSARNLLHGVTACERAVLERSDAGMDPADIAAATGQRLDRVKKVITQFAIEDGKEGQSNRAAAIGSDALLRAIVGLRGGAASAALSKVQRAVLASSNARTDTSRRAQAGRLTTRNPLPIDRPCPGLPSIGFQTTRPIAASREPCFRCGIPGARGCAHQAPFEPLPPIEHRRERDRPELRPT